jgi:hypothetical protein
MKTVLSIASITFLLVSCSNEQKESLKKSKEDIILEKCEKFIISDLNDPKSYEMINLKITDSLKRSDDLIYETDLVFSEDNVLEGFKTQKQRDSMLYLQSEISKNPKLDYLTHYSIELDYRAKNLNGALQKQKAILFYFIKPLPDGKNIMVYSNE